MDDELNAMLNYADVYLDGNIFGKFYKDRAMELCKDLINQFRGIIKTIEEGNKKNEEYLEKEIEKYKNELIEAKRERKRIESAHEESEIDEHQKYSPCDDCEPYIYGQCILCPYGQD